MKKEKKKKNAAHGIPLTIPSFSVIVETFSRCFMNFAGRPYSFLLFFLSWQTSCND